MNILRSQGKISYAVILIIDEFSFQKSQKYVEDTIVGSFENGLMLQRTLPVSFNPYKLIQNRSIVIFSRILRRKQVNAKLIKVSPMLPQDCHLVAASFQMVTHVYVCTENSSLQHFVSFLCSRTMARQRKVVTFKRVPAARPRN